MILLFTDFGWTGPYVGQMKAVLAADAPGAALVDLMHDAPAFAPGPAGRLLAALLRDLPAPPDAPGPATDTATDTAPDVVLGVVDPGVGTARRPIAVRAGGRVFVGPDNGLFGPAVAAAGDPRRADAWTLTLRPTRLSASFHGRDLFAPAAAAVARGEAVPGSPIDPARLVDLGPAPPARAGGVDGATDGAADGTEDGTEDGAPAAARDDTAEGAGTAVDGAGAPLTVLYVDGYGNAMLDLTAADLAPDAVLAVGDRRLARARTFGEVPAGAAFWYENALGLVEIAVNRGSAAASLGLAVGSVVRVRRQG